MKSRIKFGLLILLVLAVAAACAPTNVQQQPTDMTATQLAKPDPHPGLRLCRVAR